MSSFFTTVYSIGDLGMHDFKRETKEFFPKYAIGEGSNYIYKIQETPSDEAIKQVIDKLLKFYVILTDCTVNEFNTEDKALEFSDKNKGKVVCIMHGRKMGVKQTLSPL